MNKIKFYIVIFLIYGCSTNAITNDNINIESKFNYAVDLFNENKFSKAKDEFKYIINNNPGSNLSMRSQLFLAECLYNLEKYSEASNEYNRYIFVSQDPDMIERAKFFICKCYYHLSSSFNKDQEGSVVALDRLQYFIEQYPNSKYLNESEDIIKKIRNKLAKKDLESGRLYLRMEEYDSAKVYFESVINDYYDTKHYDNAIINMVLTLVLENKINDAKVFLDNNKSEFLNESNYLVAFDIINNKMNLIEYLKLIK